MLKWIGAFARWQCGNGGNCCRAETRLERKVPEVLGMDYETFTRSALLAQGAFTELLRAQVDDRAAILEKITGHKALQHNWPMGV